MTRLRLAASALLWVGLIVCSVLPAQAEEDHRPGYLALGDSVAFGYRESLPLQTYTNASNFVGYPELVARSLNLRLTNASCPGETSGSFSSADAPDNGCRVYRLAGFPLHTSYSGTQLDFAIAFLKAHRDTQLVTLDLGANDLLLLQSACGSSSQCLSQGLPPLLGSVSGNLNAIFARVRGDAGYRGRLVGLTYYSTNYRVLSVVGPVLALDLVIASATSAQGGRVADGFTTFALASESTGGDPCAAGLLNQVPGGGCEVHPSASGQALLAQAVRTAAQR